VHNTFELHALRFHLRARRELWFPAGEAANRLRGSLGKALKTGAPDLYSSFFAPSSALGPSGLRDAPRPFALRVRHLEGARIAAGEPFCAALHVFEVRRDLSADLARAIADATGAELLSVQNDHVRVALEAAPQPISAARVTFLTPTELKGAVTPEFGALLARIRDRVSALRSLYGEGPLLADFRGLGERAATVTMTSCELKHIHAERTSRGTGQRHPLGGYVGIADYSGALTEFAGYLDAARWTGVGRQTVWGKGEINWEAL
jgi:CRISPR-associated endoribonuclease Cas6